MSNLGTSIIYAKFDVWDNNPQVAGEDSHSDGDGSIVVD